MVEKLSKANIFGKKDGIRSVVHIKYTARIVQGVILVAGIVIGNNQLQVGFFTTFLNFGFGG
jgi:hypothetical protein